MGQTMIKEKQLNGFGTNITITVSGLNLQVTQSSGITLTIQWSIMKLL